MAPSGARSLVTRTRTRPSTATASFSATITASDRKSTRLNSSHLVISYAVFCLKKKNSLRLTLPRYPPLLSSVHPPLDIPHLHSLPTRRSSDLASLSQRRRSRWLLPHG